MPILKAYTLGCKVNQYETQLVREGLAGAGFREAQSDQSADLCVINTCTVTSEGDAKSRQLIRRIHRENPDAQIVVMGCYATRAPHDVAALPGVNEVVTDKREIPDLLGRFGVIDAPDGISRFGNRHRAYVKVQDGCLLRCSYCIIPFVRPPLHSRDPASIVREIQRLEQHGYQEIVLTGIHLGHYGVDFNRGRTKSEWVRLSSLLRSLAQLPGAFRIRLSSIEATEVTRELLDVMAEFPDRICPHLHICLQSGSDRVLRRMGRRWGSQRFVDRCLRFREQFHKPALTTDVIVGFPGETDEDFADTCRVCRESGFSKIHIFPFSARRGTPAAKMSDVVSKQQLRKRVAELTKLEEVLRAEYMRQLVGENVQVLIEAMDSKMSARGTSCRYVPVQLALQSGQTGQLVDVAVQSAVDSSMLLAG